MQQIQRFFLIAAVIVIIALGTLLPHVESAKKLQTQWELLQVERFMELVCRNKECSYEDYVLLHGALNYAGTSSVIEIEEYRTEQDMEGNVYYYGISWDELREMLFFDEQYYFSDNSVLVVCVNRNGGIGNQKRKYYDIVSGKD